MDSFPQRFALGWSHSLELFVHLKLPLINLFEEFIDIGAHRMPQTDYRLAGF
jgi:hypothetical protein